ncbi:MAG: inorganic pyrophosphatase [Ignavibacteria bacterium]
MGNNLDFIWREIRTILKAHPWHGVKIGKDFPQVLNAFVEIVPTDTLKYELDKQTGYLKIDRPQLYSNVCPTPYGFIPQTYCGKRVGAFCSRKANRKDIEGDGDPLDICILTEKVITHNDILLNATPIGGLRLIDGNQADDKIIAVMHKDSVFGKWTDITDCPESLIDRIRHYFLTYKQNPDSPTKTCEITHIYGRDEAIEVIKLSHSDYLDKYRNLYDLLNKEL